MTALVWGTAGERLYEAGADRGVLYLPGVPGVAWNGLTSVSETPTGGAPVPFYYDGLKYSNLSTAEEFAATIGGFSSPKEFAKCDGTASISNGLFITQQPREPFDLSYRTHLGNDTEGLEYGYKVHLVYNALAAPSGRNNATLNDAPTPNSYSWLITTMAPLISGFRPSAHLVVDSTKTPADVLEEFENLLYGTPSTPPQMPTQEEVILLFS